MKGLNRLRDAATFLAWSLQMVHHKQTNFIRRQIRERENLRVRHRQLQAEQTTSTAAKHQNQVADVGLAVEWEIGQLRMEERRLLTLFYHQAMSIEEVSKITGRSVLPRDRTQRNSRLVNDLDRQRFVHFNAQDLVVVGNGNDGF